MKLDRMQCDRCESEYDDALSKYIVRRYREGFGNGQPGGDVCPSCADSFKAWWERSEPEPSPERCLCGEMVRNGTEPYTTVGRVMHVFVTAQWCVHPTGTGCRACGWSGVTPGAHALACPHYGDES